MTGEEFKDLKALRKAVKEIWSEAERGEISKNDLVKMEVAEDKVTMTFNMTHHPASSKLSQKFGTLSAQLSIKE